ncbi:MAG: 1,4-dihydroxy-2-naphthoate octaprenyltransferase [Candidatus Marinimicrobia bacterium]|nr:1,4-dihydroxy-2-naphthoate octaprenyltransferase [Candidatus Neomarinimicrobiota bacterium]MCH8068409.1 1,4-dihydroxy-2-naphthoate octaprenyltransferase [Candidatus Neomarinimicrobiota bacterium]
MIFRPWIQAFRPRTLPLAFASIITGSGLAWAEGTFRLMVFVLALITTLFLQILSNLANDYGDFQHGVDNEARVGPDRTLQAGLISKGQMVKAMWIIALLCSIFGVWLIVEGTRGLTWGKSGLFAVLGLTAMGAAVKYTMGKNPYGYAGLGDVAVFLFFGWLGVLGTYFLHNHSISIELLLPASAIGLFTTAVLNINNMRDHKADEQSGKQTLVVRIGLDRAKRYQLSLNTGGVLLAIAFIFPSIRIPNYLFMIIAPVLINTSLNILYSDDYESFDTYLKKQAMVTFLFSILFTISINL